MIGKDRVRDDLCSEAVRLLTTAARQRRADGTASDFADFLAQALAATAANLGGPDEMLAGRPGSWEAAHVAELLHGTMRNDPEDWLPHRTEPIVVRLNVAKLIEGGDLHPCLLGLDEAIAALDAHYDDSVEDDDDAYERDVLALTARYTEAYRQYGERFTQAVRVAATSTMGGLRVPVRVDVDDDPRSRWWDRAESLDGSYELKAVIADLWRIAHDVAPLPNVEIRRRVELES